VESTTQALCDLALRFGEGEEESMVFTQNFATGLSYCSGAKGTVVLVLYRGGLLS